MRRGFTLIELMIVLGIIGLLCAIAIPNFTKFLARSRRAEVRTNLKAAYTSERAYYADKDTFTDSISALGFDPERGNRFSYVLGTSPSWVARNTVSNPVVGATQNAIEVDTFKWPAAVAQAAPVVAASVTTGPNGAFVFSSAGNIDSDPQLDSWSIASTSRDQAANSSATTCRSERAAAGEPCGDIDDL